MSVKKKQRGSIWMSLECFHFICFIWIRQYVFHTWLLRCRRCVATWPLFTQRPTPRHYVNAVIYSRMRFSSPAHVFWLGTKPSCYCRLFLHAIYQVCWPLCWFERAHLKSSLDLNGLILIGNEKQHWILITNHHHDRRYKSVSLFGRIDDSSVDNSPASIEDSSYIPRSLPTVHSSGDDRSTLQFAYNQVQLEGRLENQLFSHHYHYHDC